MGNNVDFGIRITADGKVAAAEIKAVRQETEQLAASSGKLASQYTGLDDAATRTASSARKSTEAYKQLDDELAVLLSRIDPAYRSMKQLDAGQDLLHRGLKEGLVTHRQYAEQLLNLEKSFGQAAAGAEKGMFATAGARRELIVLGHEAVSGNFSRMPGSFMVLAERIHLSGTALLALGGAAAIGVGSIVALVKAYHDGHAEMEAMNLAIAKTGNFSGQTRASLEALSASMATNSQLTIGHAKEIATALAGSGVIGAQAFERIAGLAGNFAKVMGVESGKAAAELVKLFEDPTKGAETLNKSMHFLTVAELEHIRALQETGKTYEAQTFLADKLGIRLAAIKPHLGTLERALEAASKTWSKFWDAAMDVGRDHDSPEDRLKAAQIAFTQAKINTMSYMGGKPSDAAIAALKEAQAALAAAEQAAAASRAKAQATAAQSESAALSEQAKKLVDQVSEYRRIAEIRNTIANIRDNVPESLDKTRAIYNLNKQIADVYRSMGAEALALDKSRVEGNLKLREIGIKSAQEANDAALSLGAITREQHARRKTELELELNAEQKAAEIRKRAAPLLTEQAKQALDYNIKSLDAERERIEMRGANAVAVEEKKNLDEYIQSIDKAGDADVKRLENTLAAQVRHNAEIGKTREEIELTRQAAEDAATAQMEASAQAIESLLKQNDLNEQARAIYSAELLILNCKLALHRQISAALGDGAVREANAAATKELQKNWEDATAFVQRSLYDSIAKGGEGGIAALEKTLRNAAFKVMINAVVNPAMSALGSAFGVPGAGGSAGTGNLLSAGSNAYGMLSSGGAATGAYGTFAASSAGQALGLSSAAEFMGPIAAGGTEVGLTAVGSALGSVMTALPYVGAGLAIANAIGLFGKSGGPQTGQYGSASAAGYTSEYTMSGGDTLGASALAQSSLAQITALAQVAGKTLGDLTVNQGYRLDPQGSAEGFAYRRIYAGGKLISGKDSGSDNYANAQLHTGHDDAAGVANYLGTLHTEELQALVAALGDPKLSAAAEALTRNFGELEKSLPAWVTATAQQKALEQSLMSESDQKAAALADAQKLLAATFADLGQAVPESSAAFRKLVGGLDLTTTAGQSAVVKLAGVKTAFDLVQQSAGAATVSLTGLKAAAADIKSIGSARAGLANAKYSAMSGMAGFDAAGYWKDQTGSLSTRLAGATSTSARLSIAGDLQSALQSAYEAEAAKIAAVRDLRMTALQNEQQAAQAAAQASDALNQSLRGLGDYARSLLTGDLTALAPDKALAEAQKQYQALLIGARAGNADDAGKLQGVSQNYLQLARGYYASGTDYAGIFGGVQGDLAKLGLSARGAPASSASAASSSAASSAAEAQYQASMRALQDKLLASYGDLDKQMAGWQTTLQSSLDEQMLTMTSSGADIASMATDIANLGDDIGGIVGASFERVMAAKSQADQALSAAQAAKLDRLIEASLAGTDALVDRLAAMDKRLSMIETNGALMRMAG